MYIEAIYGQIISQLHMFIGQQLNWFAIMLTEAGPLTNTMVPIHSHLKCSIFLNNTDERMHSHNILALVLKLM